MEKFVIDHDLHLHSNISLCCGDPKQTPEVILAHAEKYGLKKIALTNHFWDDTIPVTFDWYKKQNYAHICEALPLPQGKNCHFYFGAEGEMNKNFQIGIGKELYDKLEFIIIPTTHLHFDWAIDLEKDDSDERRAELWVKRLEAFADSDLPSGKTGIAHLTCALLGGGEDEKDFHRHLEILPLISDEDIGRSFEKIKKKNYGVELNFDPTRYADDELPIILRVFRIAKECGCKFYLGSDAHEDFEMAAAMPKLEAMVRVMELTEDDKYDFARS